MKLKTSLIALILGTGLVASAQGTFVYDQQAIGIIDGAGFLQDTPFGQSFTPTLDSIDFVELQLYNGGPNTIDVNIRSGSITGTILGTSLPITMSANSSGIFDFLFSNPITVTPGTQYFFEPVESSNGTEGDITTVSGYTGGDLITQGIARPGQDLWFREGIVTTVPEPASAALFVVAGFLFWKRRR